MVCQCLVALLLKIVHKLECVLTKINEVVHPYKQL